MRQDPPCCRRLSTTGENMGTILQTINYQRETFSVCLKHWTVTSSAEQEMLPRRKWEKNQRLLTAMNVAKCFQLSSTYRNTSSSTLIKKCSLAPSAVRSSCPDQVWASIWASMWWIWEPAVIVINSLPQKNIYYNIWNFITVRDMGKLIDVKSNLGDRFKW